MFGVFVAVDLVIGWKKLSLAKDILNILKILNKRCMLKGNRDSDWLTEEDWRDYLHCTKKVRRYDYEDGPLFSII